MNNVLEVKKVGKSFKDYSSEWYRVLSWFGIDIKAKQEHKILKQISFSISAGEAIAIAGQNGAGKSTLLKIITGTLKASSGSVVANGRISAILELGMGFSPDLTGRQNAYNTSGLMGYNNSQIDEVIEEIEAFAEVDEYFDQPIRTYSSGMQARVAFAVATAYRPEILIVDEVLAVGDSYFQHKSFNRIKEFQELGTTILLVSHDRAAIQSICDRVILLEKGVILRDGNPEEVMDYYNALIAQKENSTLEQVTTKDDRVETCSGTGEATVKEIGLYNEKNELIELIGVGDEVKLVIKVKVHQDIESLVLGYGIKDRLGQVMYGTNTWHTKQIINSPKSGDNYEFTMSFKANFGVGSYSIQTALVDKDTHLTANYQWKDLATVFNVINIDKTHFAGCNWSEPTIKVQRCN